MVVARRGADTHDLVSSYGSSNTAPIHKNTPIYRSIGCRLGERNGEPGVIVVTVTSLLAKSTIS
jgi:hypothetical protein